MIEPTWLKVAETQLGTAEVTGKSHNPKILEYHRTTTLANRAAGKDETPWCASFVNWCLLEAGYQGTDSALARSYLDWGTELVEPEVGCITVIRSKHHGPDGSTGSRRGFHVGFFVGNNPHSIRLLGGNQKDRVKYSNYPGRVYEVHGYRWPIRPTRPTRA